MSVAMSRSDGVTMLTLTTDPSSSCPPLCQLLGALCYSPGLCSKSHGLPPRHGGPQAALGALWIITGILHIGLGTVLMTTRGPPVYTLRWDSGCSPVWLGVLFLFFGVCCVLSERYPRRILVLLSGLLNLVGVALSITGVVLYSCTMGDVGYHSYCDRPYRPYRPPPRRRHYIDDYDWNTLAPTTMSPEQSALLERCEEIKLLQQVLTITFLSVLVTLSALDLCVGLSSAILSFKSLRRGGNKSGNKPLLQEAK